MVPEPLEGFWNSLVMKALIQNVFKLFEDKQQGKCLENILIEAMPQFLILVIL